MYNATILLTEKTFRTTCSHAQVDADVTNKYCARLRTCCRCESSSSECEDSPSGSGLAGRHDDLSVSDAGGLVRLRGRWRCWSKRTCNTNQSHAVRTNTYVTLRNKRQLKPITSPGYVIEIWVELVGGCWERGEGLRFWQEQTETWHGRTHTVHVHTCLCVTIVIVYVLML